MNCPSLLGSLASASLATMLTVAVSSSLRVIDAVLATESILTSGSLVEFSVIVSVSSFSRKRSSTVVTSMVAVVCPARITTVPESGVKSSPEIASPETE